MKEFYEADTVEPKDHKLNFADFKTLASSKYPDATEQTIQAAFNMIKFNRELIDFKQYE